MSDFDREVAPYGASMSGAEAAAIDAGLRAYMLSVYNYMALGLAVTGVAAFGIYLLSVTGDAATAAKMVRNGVEIPAQIAGHLYLTPLGHAVFVSPLKWLIIFAKAHLLYSVTSNKLCKLV